MVNKKIKVLQVVHGLAPGGIEAFLLNIIENIDRDKIEISFAVAAMGKQFHEERVTALGIRVYHTSDLNGIKNIIIHFLKLVKLIKLEGEFDVVHSHIDFFNGINLLAAFIAGVPNRISHSHNTNSAHAKNVGATISIRMYRKVMRSLINILSTKNLGCSSEANIYMYGKKNTNKNGNNVIFNGINLEKFSKINEEIKDFKIDESKINFITIGRMCEQKNSLFIVKIVNELSKVQNNIHLFWIGKGPQEGEIKKMIEEYGIEDKITLLGNRTDVNCILNKMNFMLFPSKWEGLPVTLVEAQASKVPCFISNKITDEVNIGLCTALSIEENEKIWANNIFKYIKNKNYNKKIDSKILDKFDIKNVCRIIENIYLKV
ncbi:MAG: glycosyltransferase [Romboutsia sp.]